MSTVNNNQESLLIIFLEQVILYEFPKIGNLKITQLEDGILSVSFNEGQYAKEEVELRLKKIKKLTT